MHWDLFVALVLGVLMSVFWSVTNYAAQWALVTTAAVVSITLAGLAWSQWNQLRSRLSGSDYGELLRIADQSETEVRLPYLIVRYVAIVSALWSGLVATFIEVVDSRPIEAVLLGVSVWLLAWSGLGALSLAIHASRHDKMIAQVESMREELEAEQREHKRRLEKEREGSPDPERETT